MDVILDTNILVADIWQDSQNFRFLMDYIEKTNSYVLIPSVVDVEIKAIFTRKVNEHLQEIESAIKRAERFGVKQIPSLVTKGILDSTHQAWDFVYETLFKKKQGKIIPLTPTVADEAIRRAAFRLAPCKENGDGIRDAFIWLQILEYCKERKSDETVAFISLNTHDFSSQDKTTLRPELENDVKDKNIKLLYYPSLESFLKKYATPISHVTSAWLEERINFSFIEKEIQEYFKTSWKAKWHKNKFQISKSEFRDYYQIDDDITDIDVFDVNLENFIVWQFDKNHIEVSLDFSARLEGETEGELIYSPHIISRDDDDENFKSRQTLYCHADLLFHFAATIAGDKVEIGEIEDINKF